eukprot:scaffold14090_cov31-Tisochrysis_lutea.AAC.5
MPTSVTAEMVARSSGASPDALPTTNAVTAALAVGADSSGEPASSAFGVAGLTFWVGAIADALAASVGWELAVASSDTAVCELLAAGTIAPSGGAAAAASRPLLLALTRGTLDASNGGTTTGATTTAGVILDGELTPPAVTSFATAAITRLVLVVPPGVSFSPTWTARDVTVSPPAEATPSADSMAAATTASSAATTTGPLLAAEGAPCWVDDSTAAAAVELVGITLGTLVRLLAEAVGSSRTLSAVTVSIDGSPVPAEMPTAVEETVAGGESDVGAAASVGVVKANMGAELVTEAVPSDPPDSAAPAAGAMPPGRTWAAAVSASFSSNIREAIGSPSAVWLGCHTGWALRDAGGCSPLLLIVASEARPATDACSARAERPKAALELKLSGEREPQRGSAPTVSSRTRWIDPRLAGENVPPTSSTAAAAEEVEKEAAATQSSVRRGVAMRPPSRRSVPGGGRRLCRVRPYLDLDCRL